jgi:hypothetical protein
MTMSPSEVKQQIIFDPNMQHLVQKGAPSVSILSHINPITPSNPTSKRTFTQITDSYASGLHSTELHTSIHTHTHTHTHTHIYIYIYTTSNLWSMTYLSRLNATVHDLIIN